MWEAQLYALHDYHVIIPDLPGFGASNQLPWESVADTADQVADLIRTRAHDGEAHVVGLSLGAILGTVLLARHPELARSAMFSGAALQGVHGFIRWSGMAQLRFWKSPRLLEIPRPRLPDPGGCDRHLRRDRHSGSTPAARDA